MQLGRILSWPKCTHPQPHPMAIAHRWPPPRDGYPPVCRPRDYLGCMAFATRTRFTPLESNPIGQLWAISSLPKKTSMKILPRSFAFGPLSRDLAARFHGRPLGPSPPPIRPSPSPRRLTCRPFAHSHSFSGHRPWGQASTIPVPLQPARFKGASFLVFHVSIPPSTY
jgi:hypothetical protein